VKSDGGGVQVTDGSSLAGLQVVVSAGVDGHQHLMEGRINTGAAVSAKGKLVQSPGGKQSVSTFPRLHHTHPPAEERPGKFGQTGC
jgi:aspartyl/asparaginyl-tRNA synthetase